MKKGHDDLRNSDARLAELCQFPFRRSGLEKSGRILVLHIVAFCDWDARYCDQKTWCSRNFAPKTRRPGASLRPDEHSSRPDSENKLETAFVSNSDERERRESRQLLVTAVGS